MTSTLGVWMLTGYGAEKAPHLMQFSVHCDHLRSVLFWRARPLPYGEILAALTTLLRKKMCSSIYGHERGRNFYGLPAFFTIRRNMGRFDQCFSSFSSLSAIRRNTDRFKRVFPAIRRKTCCFDQVFSQNFFYFLHHTEKCMPFC